MHADWEKLMGSYSGTSDTLIASAKCQTSDRKDAPGRSLCDHYNTHSIPHLMYGTASNMKEYNGDRDYSSMLAFAKKNVGQPSSEGESTNSNPSMDTCDLDGTVV